MLRAYPVIVLACATLGIASESAGQDRELAGPRHVEAEKALAAGPFSVTQKERVPPSGDKHDFLTLAPYWWPDPAKPGGLPYVRRDGETNPESKRGTDDAAFSRMHTAVMTLSGAYRDTHDERYAARAAVLLRTWFLDPTTRMNPNLDYGQGVPGRSTGRGAGIISTRHLVGIVDAARWLESSPNWSARDREGLKQWSRAFATWLQTSKNGREESHAQNNHGTWYEAQLGALLLYTDQRDVARARFEKAKTRIVSQFERDGKQPRELERTRSWSYSVMNLEGWFQLSRLAEEAGVDLWNFRTSDGRSVRMAFDYLMPFASGTARWPEAQITPFEVTAFLPLLDQAAKVWNDERYQALADRLRQK